MQRDYISEAAGLLALAVMVTFVIIMTVGLVEALI